MNKLRVFTAFSGYDSQLLALRNIGMPYECVGWSEIDKYAIQAHNALFPEVVSKNYGDIPKIDWAKVPDFDLFTYSFPCTDISNAGLQKGLSEGSGTRSSLLWECKRAIEVKRPKYLLLENVKALVGKKFLPDFLEWDACLRGLGYTNFTQVLNAKDYGVPQNRERVFVVSILGEAWYNFPEKQPLRLCLADMLEENVDEKYYLSGKIAQGFINHSDRKQKEGCGFKFEPTTGDGIGKAVTTKEGNRATDNFVISSMQAHASIRNDGVCPAPTAAMGMDGGQIPMIQQIGNSITKQGGFGNPQIGRVYSGQELSPTLDTCTGGNRTPKIAETSKIRKLTPREAFRLMGLYDTDIDIIQSAGISDTQQYKLAGNSIVVDVLEKIFRMIFITNKYEENTK